MGLSSRSLINLSTLDALLLAIPDPATVFTLDSGALLASNVPAQQLFSPAQLSLSAEAIRTEDSVETLRERVEMLRQTPTEMRHLPAFTENLSTADNTTINVETHLTLFPSDSHAHLVLSVSRIRQTTEADDFRAQAQRKSSFFASLSRELRSPLTSILGYVDLVADPDTTPQDRADYLKIIRRSGESMLTLIHDLTDLSLAEARSLSLEHAPFSIGLVVAEVLSLMRPRARTRGLNLIARYTTAVPRKLHGDSARLRQVISSLLTHCIDRASHGDVTFQIALIGDGQARQLSFDINGLCPPSSDSSIESIFDPLVACSSGSKGTALALPLALHLARLMGGDIIVYHGDGSRFGFRFTVPLSAKDLSDLLEIDYLSPPVEPSPGTPPNLSGRVLLVEDSDDDRRLVQRILQRVGIDVSCLSDGTHALTAALHPFDVILMDLQLPDLDGLDVTRRLRRRGETIPIVALTAAALSGDRERCLQAGCTAYLSKPIDKPSLLQTLSSLISKRRETDNEVTSEQTPKISLHPLRSTREDDSVIRELLPKFVARLPRYVDEVHRLVHALDAPGAERAAQSLAGTASNYGFESLSACASRVVAACRHEGCNSDAVGNALRTMNDLIERIRLAYPPRASIPPPSA